MTETEHNVKAPGCVHRAPGTIAHPEARCVVCEPTTRLTKAWPPPDMETKDL